MSVCVTGDATGNHQVPSDIHGVNEHSSQARTDSLQPTNRSNPHISTQPLASNQGICTSLVQTCALEGAN